MHLSEEALVKMLKRSWDPEEITESRFEQSEQSSSKSQNVVDYLAQPISYEDFFYKYLFCNKPCVFGKWSTEDWKSRKEWTSSGRPSFKLLRAQFAGSNVPVADCRQRYFNSQCKSELKFEDFLSYWEKYITDGYQDAEPCLYLKDWHFVKNYELYNAYEVPPYFQSDWLNEFSHMTSKDDFRFVYMGPKSSWTPFHADVYRSFSWSANICGRKKWILFPSGDEKSLQNERGELPYDITELNSQNNAFVVVQEPGEVIFVPSGWHHQVHNVDDTISINHNWLNGTNLHMVTNFLLSQLQLVKNEISDCRASMSDEEWLHQCQVILKADSGMDFNDFIEFLNVIAMVRISAISAAIKSCVKEHDEKNTDKAARRELHTVIGEKLSSIHLDDVTLKSDKMTEFSGTMCLNHALFDLCMILDVIHQLVIESSSCIEKSTFDEAKMVLKNIVHCLQTFVNHESSES